METDEFYEEKARRMRESHVVCLEVYVERLNLNYCLSKFIYENIDNVKIRVKFANFPCIELDGTYEEEFIALENASTRTIRNSSFKDTVSESDFFRRGRFSLGNQKLRDEVTNKIWTEDKGPEELEPPVEDEDEDEEDGKKEIKKGDGRKGSTLRKTSFRRDQYVDYTEMGPGDFSESSLNLEHDNGIPFSDSRALVVPLTPQQLLYHLVNQPLRVFLLCNCTEKCGELVGQSVIALSDMADIVSHMILSDVGFHSVSKISGYYPMCDPYAEDIGDVKIKLRLATYGVSSLAKLCSLDPDINNVKFMSDEIIEDPYIESAPPVVRDVAKRAAIVTGEENVPEVPKGKKSSENGEEKDENGPKTKCINNWRTIIPT